MGDLRKLRVDMQAILEAMADLPPEFRCSLDLETGEVVNLNPDDDEEEKTEEPAHRLEEIPRVEGPDMYRLMERFADSVDEEDIREKLASALGGRGAFGRFRGVIACYRYLEERWFRERETYLVKEAVDWLNSSGIDPVYELRPRPKTPVPDPPAERGPKVRLEHVLVLGAPEGKTEVLEGRVRREIVAKDEGQARALFKSLARDVCEYKGTAWRNRFIEGGSEFESRGLTVRVLGKTVEVWLDVPPPVLRAFGF